MCSDEDAAHYAPNPLAGPHPPFICHSTSEQSMWLGLASCAGEYAHREIWCLTNLQAAIPCIDATCMCCIFLIAALGCSSPDAEVMAANQGATTFFVKALPSV